MEKYKGVFRIPTNRHQDYDYSSDGAYYVTICTLNKAHYFGKIADKKMNLTKIGYIAIQEWLKTPAIRPDMGIILDEFSVMPNHFHGIIIFNNGDIGHRGDQRYLIGTMQKSNYFGPQSKNLGSVVRGFKACVKTYASANKIEFSWQSSYYDHIIRDESDFERIKSYIRDNVENWDKDEYS